MLSRFSCISLPCVFRVWLRNATVYRKIFLLGLPPTLFEPLIYFAVLSILILKPTEGIGGVSYLYFLAPGLIVFSAIFSTSVESTVCTHIRLKFQKTHDAMVSTVINSEDIAVGEILWATSKGVMFGTFTGIILALFGFIKSPWALCLPFILFLGCLPFAIIGMICTTTIYNLEHFQYYFTLVLVPMVFCSDIFFPIERLPHVIQAIAWFLPLIHIVAFARSFALGHISMYLLVNLVWLILVIFLLILIPVNLMKRRLIR